MIVTLIACQMHFPLQDANKPIETISLFVRFIGALQETLIFSVLYNYLTIYALEHFPSLWLYIVIVCII